MEQNPEQKPNENLTKTDNLLLIYATSGHKM